METLACLVSKMTSTAWGSSSSNCDFACGSSGSPPLAEPFAGLSSAAFSICSRMSSEYSGAELRLMKSMTSSRSSSET